MFLRDLYGNIISANFFIDTPTQKSMFVANYCRHMHRDSHEKSPFGLTNDHETLRLDRRLPSQDPPKVFGFRFGLTANHLSFRMLAQCEQRVARRWCVARGTHRLSARWGRCHSYDTWTVHQYKFIVKGASVPIRNDDADAKMLPSCAVFRLRPPGLE